MTKQRRRFWLWTAAALLTGLLLRLWFIRHYAHVAGDSLIYGDIAKNLILHHLYGFSEPGPAPGSIQLRPTLIRLPGYPLFLAACFRLFGMEHYGAVLYVQAFADLLTCLLCAALAGRLFGERAFLPVLFLATLCPFTAGYPAAALTETLVLTTLALAFYAFARWQQAGASLNFWLYLIAAALASSILLRPEQGLLAAAMLPAMVWATHLASSVRRAHQPTPVPASYWAKSFTPALAVALCTILPFIPWTFRNAYTFHVFQPLAPRSASDPGELQLSGFNRWYRTWAIEFISTDAVYWNYDGSAIALSDIPARAFTAGCLARGPIPTGHSSLYARTAALLADYNQSTDATPANDAAFGQLAAERIHASPLCYYIALPVARVLNMAFRPRTEMLPIPLDWWKPTTPPRQRRIATGYAALNLGYFVTAFAGVLVWGRRGWRPSPPLAAAMAVTVLLRCALLLTLDNSEPRYTLEFFPVLFTCAGALFLPRRESLPENP